MKPIRFFMPKAWRLPGLIALSAMLAGAAWFWYEGSLGSIGNSGRGGRSKVVAVEATPVARDTVRELRTFPGTLHARAAFDLAPKIGGRLEKLNVDVGDVVKKGQVVARLDDDELVHLVHQARAELGVTRAALAEARSLVVVKQRQFERSERLFEKGIGAEMELEADRSQAEAQHARVQVAQAQVGQSKAFLRAAEVRLAYTVVRADWNDGNLERVVGQRYASEGEMLAPNKPILSVLDISSLIAVVFTTEADYARLRLGQPVELAADAYPGRKFKGAIARIAPQFEQASRQARMEVTIPNPDQLLKPGMFARVEVEIARSENAILVPAQSVVTRSGRKGVFMVDPEKSVARFVPVHTGLAQGDRIQVLEPALSGQVASLGQHLLRDGATIRLISGNNGSAPAQRGGGFAKDRKARGGKVPDGKATERNKPKEKKS